MKRKFFRYLLVGIVSIFLFLMIFLITTHRTIRDLIEMIPLGAYSLSEEVKFDDYTLNVRDYGQGQPTIIIEPGLNCGMHWYYELQMNLSKHYRTICYNHPGIGNSTTNNNPRTLPYYVDELKALLIKKEINPPYVLIGHSLGGHIIRYYAHLYPKEVACLIFLDDTNEDWFNYVKKNWSSDEANNYFDWWNPEINMQNYKSGGLAELAKWEANCDSIRGIPIPEDIPVLMFTGNTKNHYRSDSINQSQDKYMWAKLQSSILKNVKNTKQIIDWETGHSLHRDKPQMVQSEINHFIESLNY